MSSPTYPHVIVQKAIEIRPTHRSQPTTMRHPTTCSHVLFLVLIAIAGLNTGAATTSLLFTTLGRSRYTFDIFTLPILPAIPDRRDELRLTDGESVNFNGHFPNPSSYSSLLSLLSNHSLIPNPLSISPLQFLLYVTERHGTSNIYLDAYYDTHENSDQTMPGRRSALEIQERIQVPLLQPEQSNGRISMKDRPSIAGDNLIYVSTHEDSGAPRQSWAAVYSTHLPTGKTRRLTPVGMADFSPAVSPSGVWTAVASSGDRGWNGEVEELNTDIYVFRNDGDENKRFRVVRHGGWPCWVDDYTLYFHRRSEKDGWWSIYRAVLPRRREIREELVVVERITPPGFHAFTPAASPGNKRFIAMATRRPSSDFRQIELLNIDRNQFIEVTGKVSPNTHHFNPFLFPDGSRVGYHKCRGSDDNGRKGSSPLFLESIESPAQDISLFRVDASFPSFSPDGKWIAYVGLPGLYVANRDGSDNRKVFSGNAFPTAWDWKRKGIVYTSVGQQFAEESKQVDIVSINVDDPSAPIQKLSFGSGNNAFPSPSPDGKWVVFRSGRSGYKNLYIMDALEGEKGGIMRLTEGPWTDTMCNWSPDGEWIAFASDREDPAHIPGSGGFGIYLIHPNGTGLRKVVYTGEGGKANHPWFSPDSRSIAFTTDYAGVSAEPISNPHHYQPYGEIYVARIDGSRIRRLTHNSYEDGTPTWGPMYMKPADVVEQLTSEQTCSFEDCHWLSQAPKRGYQVQDKLAKHICG